MFHRVSLVEPLPNSTKLKVNPEGIAALKQLTGPISPIVVIGPYRSGKSFLINQMLQQSCGAFTTQEHLILCLSCDSVCWAHLISEHCDMLQMLA